MAGIDWPSITFWTKKEIAARRYGAGRFSLTWKREGRSPSSMQNLLHRLAFEQSAFTLDTPTVAGKRAIFAHDAVAGDGDRDCV